MTIITVLYILIGMKLRKSRRGPSNVNQELTVEPYRYAQSRRSQTHVIRMLGKNSIANGLSITQQFLWETATGVK